MPKVFQGICALLLLPVLAGQAFVQNVKTAKVLLVETGEGFHGDEVKARNGERWLGLYVTKRSSFLAESTLTVRRVFDAVVDEDELGWYLLWAGDSKLDLYLSLSDHYNVEQRMLFLSSQAKAGKLVSQVAEFVTTGC